MSKTTVELIVSEADAPAHEPRVRATSEPLDDVSLADVLSKLPPLPEAQTNEFVLRRGTDPPPRTGEDVRETISTWPDDREIPPSDASGATLKLATPRGDVDAAAKITLTFDRPVVPIGWEGTPPFDVEPSFEGRWRALGTNTLVLEPRDRLPGATHCRITVPAGAVMPNGITVAAAHELELRTAPLTLLASYPVRQLPARTAATVVLRFDQRIDPQAIAAHVQSDVQLQLATTDLTELREFDPDAADFVGGARPGTWIALRTDILQPGHYGVRLPAGAPSAEGPMTSTEEQRFGLEVAGPFTAHASVNDQPPNRSFVLTLTNAIDPTSVDSDDFEVTPEPRGPITAYGYERQLTIDCAKAGNTQYLFRVPNTVVDRHGQRLSGNREFVLQTGEARPALSGSYRELVTVPWDAPRHVSVVATNLKKLDVAVYEVTPEDWSAYQQWRRDARHSQTPPPGSLVGERAVDVSETSRDAATCVDIDISWALPTGSTGHRVVDVRPTPSHSGDYPIVPHRVWMQSTRVGLSAWRFDDALHVWVTGLADGAPLAGRMVHVVAFGQWSSSEPTGANGAVEMLGQPAEALLIVPDGDDHSILPIQTSYFRPSRRELVGHVFDDRGMYRPGETVTLSGWARRPAGVSGSDLEIHTGPARLHVKDARHGELLTGALTFDDQGRFETSIALPDDAMLGYAFVEIEVARLGTLHHQFQIQEFRRPEFEVTVDLVDPGPHLVGDEVAMRARATYYSGEPLAAAETHWDVTVTTTTYSPPGWPGFVFGRHSWPWFGWRTTQSEASSEVVTGRTGARGVHHIRASVPTVDPPQPVLLTGSARVRDVNQQNWSGSASAIVHPSSICAGARTARSFVGAGDDIGVDLIATGLDGAVVTGRQLIAVLERGRSKQVRGVWQTEWTEVHREAVASAASPVTVQLPTAEGGSHRVVVTTADHGDRLTRTEVDVWVSGGRSQTVDEEKLTIIPRDTMIETPSHAEFAVAANFSRGHGRWFVTHGALVRSGDFELTDGGATLSVPVGVDLLPSLKLHVTVVGSDDDGVPTVASGRVEVPISDQPRRLNAEIAPQPVDAEPGSRVAVDVAVSKPDGTPASGGRATVWVVDEAVLALSGYATPDPVTSMYPDFVANVQSFQSRRSVSRSAKNFELMDGVGGAPAGAPMLRAAGQSAFGGGGGAEPRPIAVRKSFDALATFVGGVQLDDAGRATVEFDLPDSLTRYRVMVNAQLDADKFGSGDATMTARLPLMVRPSPPRFANFGDRFELAVLVQNATAARCDVDVAIRGANLELERGDHDGRRITLGAGERAELRFPAATIAPGAATFDVVADTVSAADAAAGSFPVYSPATTEAVATYGTIDAGVSEHLVEAPADAVRLFGGLEITTSSTALQALTDAVVYLARYPYDCAEQRASRVLAISALRDVLGAFEAAQLGSPQALNLSIGTDVLALSSRQNPDGGWGFWCESWPIVTIHVVHALVQAQQSGVEVRPEVLGRGLAYLDQIEKHLDRDQYSVGARLTLRAYAAFVRTRAGEPDRERALAVVRDAEAMDAPPLVAAGWCLAVLHDTPAAEVLLNFALNRVSQTEATAMFAADVDRSGAHLLLGSERRTDAVMLWALMDARPDSDLITKLVYGLLAHRKRGRWGSTQENAHVLLALNRYFKKYESTTPDFFARAWLGERYAGGHQFDGRSTVRHHIVVPMAQLTGHGTLPLLLQKDGDGRMYYRVGLRYALQDHDVEAVDRGFVVGRRYEAVDDDADVGRRDDGTWVFRAGARVRVTVSMVAPMRRHHVALVDPLPAGLEPLNPALATTERLPDAATSNAGVSRGASTRTVFWRRWRSTWFEHQSLRDERAEAFTSLLWEGHHEYVYHARATTVGEFVVPPPKAEEMYSPEVFGRGRSDRVVVVEM